MAGGTLRITTADSRQNGFWGM